MKDSILILLIFLFFTSCENQKPNKFSRNLPFVVDTFYTSKTVAKYSSGEIIDHFDNRFEYFGEIHDTIYAFRSPPYPPKSEFYGLVEVERLFKDINEVRKTWFQHRVESNDLKNIDKTGLVIRLNENQKIQHRYPLFIMNVEEQDKLRSDSIIFSSGAYFDVSFFAQDANGVWKRINKYFGIGCGSDEEIWYEILPDNYCAMVYSPACNGNFNTRMKAVFNNDFDTITSNEIVVSLDTSLFTKAVRRF